MRGLSLAASIALLLTASVIVSAAEIKTAMSWAQPSGSPAALTQSTHSLTDYLASAQLRNMSNQAIAGYRVGWVVVQQHRTTIKMGDWMSVPARIQPGSQAQVPAQAVDPKSLPPDMYLIAFFVAEVKFADSSVWAVNQQEVKRPAELQTALAAH